LTVWSKWMKIGQNGWLCTYWSKMPFFNKRSPPPPKGRTWPSFYLHFI
jgi:hypothetical protein